MTRSLGPSWRTAGIEVEGRPRSLAAVEERPSSADSQAAYRRWCVVRADWTRRRAALRREAETLPQPLAWWAGWLLDAADSADPVVRAVLDDAPGGRLVRLARIEVVDREISDAITGRGQGQELADAVAWLGRRLEGEDAAWGCWALRRSCRLAEQQRRGDAVVGGDGVGIDPDGRCDRPHGVMVGERYVRT